MKYKELYEQGAFILKNAGIEDAGLDARLLLEFLCKTGCHDLFVYGDREMEEAIGRQYLEMIQKRKSHFPLQYITGEQEFMGLRFLVNENVLIPRQDTEHLVEEVMRNIHDGMKILDMCTGSGCVLLSILRYSNDCTGVGVDISEQALSVARKNAESLGFLERSEFLQSNLFESVTGCFDMIVSNPPYIQTNIIETLMPEVKKYEPVLALDGKEDGLFFYREIVKQSGAVLKRGGQLFFEIGYDQAGDVLRIMEDHGFKEIIVQKDFSGLDRVIYGTFLGGNKDV